MRSFLFFLISVVVFVTAPLTSSAEQKPAVKIGALMALTGPFAMQGTAFTEGMKIATEEVNSSGGVDGRELILIVEDSHGDSKAAQSASMKLAKIDKIVAGITCSYPETMVGGGNFQKFKIPSIALWDSSPEIDDMGDYVFSIGPWVLSAGEKAAEFSAKDLNAETAVIINTVEEWSELVPTYFQAAFQKAGGKVVARFQVNPSESDFRSVLTKTKSLNPDVIYAPLTHNIVAFHRQASSLKLAMPIVSSDIISEEHLQQASEEFEGVYQTNVKDPANVVSKQLFAQYKEKYGKEVTLPWFVATGYDAVKLLSHAIAKVGTNSAKIKDQLYQVQGLPGAAQTISINENGSSPHLEKMFQVKGGRFIHVG